MRIDRIELNEIQLTLQERFEISSGWTEVRRIPLITLHGEGQVGWGELVAGEFPSYSSETVDTAWQMLTSLIVPAVLGTTPETAPEVLSPVDWVRGHRMAKACVEMAAWDLEAKVKGVSLKTLLGGVRDEVEVGVSIGIQRTIDRLLEKVENYLEQGYRKIKVKIKPGRDLEPLRAVRDRFPSVPLMADANSAYRLADAPRLKELDDLDLMMIEQPLAYDDYLDHGALQAELSTPICLDESIRSVDDTRLALSLDASRIINIKPGRVGGLASSRSIEELCRGRDIPVWCGGMLESGIGRAHNLALASLPGFTKPGDISESRRYYAQDVVLPEFTMSDGLMTVPSGPGIGVEPDMDRIAELTVRREVFEA
jgi:O-succinylbenzoate synthase